jgi:hypothetical protein
MFLLLNVFPGLVFGACPNNLDRWNVEYLDITTGNWNRECINKLLVGTLKAAQLIPGALNFMVLRVWIL